MANQAAFSAQMMCRLLSVSTSGFYAWEDRAPSERSRFDLYLTGKIHAIHRRSNGAYGSPMIHAELSEDHGIHVGCKRVARLMRAAHLQGVWPHRFVITTVVDADAKRPIDLVDRGFYAEYPDRLWVADITYVPTWSGFLYLAAVLDMYSRKVVGWAMENHLRTESGAAGLAKRDHPASPRRRDPPLGPRLPIHELRIWQTLPGSRCDALDGFGR